MKEEGTILLIERAGGPKDAFADALVNKGYTLEVCRTGRSAINNLKSPESRCILVILNAASLGTSGIRICNRLSEVLHGTPIIHIMPEEVEDHKSDACAADITLVMPFTSRKLVNRIKRLTHDGEGSQIQVGKAIYMPGVHLVQAYGRETKLTPKAAALLNLFIQHPDEILERSFLMSKVWETDYFGDTRTLDVHIRWVREAIEKDPAKPKHIKTVRGRGYRFDPKPKKKRKHKHQESEEAPTSSTTMNGGKEHKAVTPIKP